MRKSALLALAALLAVSGATAVSARGHMSNANKTPGASDTLTLSGDQQKSIWNDVSQHATNETAPSGFTAAAAPRCRRA